MYDPTFMFPLAHTIEPDSLEFLAELVSPEEWAKSKTEMEMLSRIKHPLGGGATYYVLMLDPSNKTLRHVIDADTLYVMYETKMYSEEILQIVSTK